jgi:tetratricopeptide (TPR) repeat protein
MAEGGAYITNLRRDWSKQFGGEPPFLFFAVAGDRDQFVPPESSLAPFQRQFHEVVAGDHLSMVKPDDARHEGVGLLIGVLRLHHSEGKRQRPAQKAEQETPPAPVVDEISRQADRDSELPTEAQVVRNAIHLRSVGRSTEAIELLQRNLHLGSDIRGTLAGFFKRAWLESRADAHAKQALQLYHHGLQTAEARKAQDPPERYHAQVYYLAINLAFVLQVALNRKSEAQAMARLALAHCAGSPESIWRTATEGEAHLYLGDYGKALEKYREAVALQPEPWQMISTGQQAYQFAAKLGDRQLQERLQNLFNPESRQINKVFISYSHRNQEWLERLRGMMSPLLREGELDLWADTRIQSGDQWLSEIGKALASSRIAVLLVSSEFLASKFIQEDELPVIFAAAQRGEMKLIWVYVNHALYEETPIKNYQAAHDVRLPLAALAPPDQDGALKSIALKIKAAVYD